MMKYAALIALALVMAFASTLVWSDDGSSRKGLVVGVVVAWNQSNYRDYDDKVLPLPMVNYEGERFFFRGLMIGSRLWSSEGQELAATLSPIGNRFLHSHTSDPHLRHLDNREISSQLGLQWTGVSTWGVMTVAAQHEVTGHGAGNAFDVNYAYPMPFGKSVIIAPTIGAVYYSSALNDYYYGISRNEAQRSGMTYYRSGSGTSPYTGVSAVLQLGHRWSVLASMTFSRLSDSVRASPMVEGGSTQNYSIALSYRL